jgi:hypothetical protein
MKKSIQAEKELTDYFERSQRIKEIVEQSPALLEQIASTFVKPNRKMLLGEGYHNEIYLIGKTHEGTHLALRIPKMRHPDIHYADGVGIDGMEFYCQAAEYISEIGCKERGFFKLNRTVDFCIGVVYADSYRGSKPAVLTEDITKGKKYDARDDNAGLSGVFKKGFWTYDLYSKDPRIKDRVFVDVDHAYDFDERLNPYIMEIDGKKIEPRYFAEKNRINIAKSSESAR